MDLKETLKFIRFTLTQKRAFLFWAFVRGVDSTAPIIQVYLISQIVSTLSSGTYLNQNIILLGLSVLGLKITDNILRLLSKNRMAIIIKQVELETQTCVLSSLSKKAKIDDEQLIQAAQNLTDYLSDLLNYLKDSGIPALIGITAIPVIFMQQSSYIFWLEVGYIILYTITDIYTTSRYRSKVDSTSKETEKFFKSILEGNTQKQKENLLKRLVDQQLFSFWEWSALQHLSGFAYVAALCIAIYEVVFGHQEVGVILLYTSYMGQTQGIMNSLSNIFDKLTNVDVALKRIEKSGNLSLSFLLSEATE